MYFKTMKKKILFFHWNCIVGGEARTLIDIASAIDKEKYDVSVMLMHAGGGMYKEAEKKLNIVPLFQSFHVPNNRACQKLRSMVINFVEKKRQKYPKLYHRLAIGKKYDLEIAFSFENAENVIINSSNKKSKKMAWIHCDFLKDSGLINYHKQYDKNEKYYGKIDKYVCVSKSAENSFKQVFGDKYDTVVKYNPVDRAKILKQSYEEVSKYDISEKENIICTVGRISFEKGYDRLVRIHAELLRKGINNTLFIIGHGSESDEKKLKEIIAQEGVQQSVILTGYDSNPHKYVAKSKFFVCSSYTEGLSMVSAEALALGIPVVASCPSVGELFGNEQCGIISDVNDDSLMAAMEKMLTDEEFYDSCKKAAERRAPYFDMQYTISAIENVFDELLEGK